MDPKLEGIAVGFFQVHLRLPMSLLKVQVFNHIKEAPHLLSCNSYLAFNVMDRLNFSPEFGNGSIELWHFMYYFSFTKVFGHDDILYAAKSRGVTIFQTPNKTGYGGSKWLEIGGRYYEGEPLYSITWPILLSPKICK